MFPKFVTFHKDLLKRFLHRAETVKIRSQYWFGRGT